jgi:hypothetical protein
MSLRYQNPENRAASRVGLLRSRSNSLFFGLPLFAMLFIGGCPSKPVHHDLGKNGLIKPPLVVARDADTTPPVISPSAWPLPVVLRIPPPIPPPVRRPPNTPESEPVKAEAPQISPQLSPDVRARAQASAEENMRIAQRNLDSANGKRLNATQQDMSDKIRGFLKQAQEAIAISDWSRASSLAEKARLLSDELVKSLRS